MLAILCCQYIGGRVGCADSVGCIAYVASVIFTSSDASGAIDAGTDYALSACVDRAASSLVLQVLTTLSGHDFNHYCLSIKIGLSRTPNDSLLVLLSLRLAKILHP